MRRSAEARAGGCLGLVSFWAVVVLALATAEAAVRTRMVSPAIFAAPSQILLALVDLAAKRDLLEHALSTLERTLLAFGVGLLLGAAVAAALFLASPRVRRPAEGLLDFLRSIPATALLPLFIAIFGVGDANKIAVGASAAMFVVTVGMLAALQDAAARFRVVLLLYRPSGMRRCFLVLLPAALRQAIATARLAISACLVLVVVGEMFIGSHSGLGYLINDLQYGDNRAAQYAAVLASGVLGFLLNAAFEFAGRAVQHRGFDV